MKILYFFLWTYRKSVLIMKTQVVLFHCQCHWKYLCLKSILYFRLQCGKTPKTRRCLMMSESNGRMKATQRQNPLVVRNQKLKHKTKWLLANKDDAAFLLLNLQEIIDDDNAPNVVLLEVFVFLDDNCVLMLILCRWKYLCF